MHAGLPRASDNGRHLICRRRLRRALVSMLGAASPAPSRQDILRDIGNRIAIYRDDDQRIRRERAEAAERARGFERARETAVRQALEASNPEVRQGLQETAAFLAAHASDQWKMVARFDDAERVAREHSRLARARLHQLARHFALRAKRTSPVAQRLTEHRPHERRSQRAAAKPVAKSSSGDSGDPDPERARRTAAAIGGPP